MMITGVSTPFKAKASTTSMPSFPGILTSTKRRIKLSCEQGLESCVSILSFFDHMLLVLEDVAKGVSDETFVVNDEDAGHVANIGCAGARTTPMLTPREGASLPKQPGQALLSAQQRSFRRQGGAVHQCPFCQSVPRSVHPINRAEALEQVINQHARHTDVWNAVRVHALDQM